jgi:hypothetical protein
MALQRQPKYSAILYTLVLTASDNVLQALSRGGVADELISDWLADRFGIDQRALLRPGWNP